MQQGVPRPHQGQLAAVGGLVAGYAWEERAQVHEGKAQQLPPPECIAARSN